MVIKGRTISGTTNAGDVLTISFTDDSKMTVKRAPRIPRQWNWVKGGAQPAHFGHRVRGWRGQGRHDGVCQLILRLKSDPYVFRLRCI